MLPEQAELESYLLGLVMHHPKRVIQLAIGTGIAIAYELASRGHMEVLERANVDDAFTDGVCELVMWHWVHCARVGGISEADFQALLTAILTMARAEHDHT